MTNFYTASDDVAVLRERIEELARIRQDYAASLGSSLFAATKNNDSLRWGRESLYNGIANCDEERDALLKRIAELSEPWKYAVKAGAPEGSLVVVDAPEVEDSPDVNNDADAEVEIESKPEVEPEAEVEIDVLPAYDADLVEGEPEDEPQPELETEHEGEAQAPIDLESFFASDPSSVDDTTNISLDQTAVTEAIAEPEAAVHEPVSETPEETAVPEMLDGIPCPTCGTVALPGQRFCMECGTKLPEPASNVCPHCGSPTEPSFRFCMECGYRLV